MNATTITIGECRLSYVHVFEPYTSMPGQEPKYSAVLLIPKTNTAAKAQIDEAIAAAVQQAVAGKWNGAAPANIQTTLHDGDGVKSSGEPYGAECKGHWVLNAGADKVSMNSSAVRDPDVITECAENFGKQCIVVAIDAKKEGDSWKVYTHGGTKRTELDAVEWACRAEDLGAGEILLTSMDADGVKTGYDIPLTAAISDEVRIPVIASGGCGSIEHIYDVFTQTDAAAALAASIFHFREHTVGEVKQYLKDRGVLVR